MKNTTVKKKLHKLPSQKTRWAYWMQAIEPTSKELNEAFPDYHPQWVQMSQSINISPVMFKALREGLGISQVQCAAYLRTTPKTVGCWERGDHPIPFAAFEVLRLVIDSAQFKLAHPAWDGWFIGKSGELNSPDVGGKGFTPELLNWYSFQRSEASVLKIELRKLTAKLGEAQEENTKLRQMYVAEGVVDELATMSETINQLMLRIATARVIPFATPPVQLQEKSA